MATRKPTLLAPLAAAGIPLGPLDKTVKLDKSKGGRKYHRHGYWYSWSSKCKFTSNHYNRDTVEAEVKVSDLTADMLCTKCLGFPDDGRRRDNRSPQDYWYGYMLDNDEIHYLNLAMALVRANGIPDLSTTDLKLRGRLITQAETSLANTVRVYSNTQIPLELEPLLMPAQAALAAARNPEAVTYQATPKVLLAAAVKVLVEPDVTRWRSNPFEYGFRPYKGCTSVASDRIMRTLGRYVSANGAVNLTSIVEEHVAEVVRNTDGVPAEALEGIEWSSLPAEGTTRERLDAAFATWLTHTTTEYLSKVQAQIDEFNADKPQLTVVVVPSQQSESSHDWFGSTSQYAMFSELTGKYPTMRLSQVRGIYGEVVVILMTYAECIVYEMLGGKLFQSENDIEPTRNNMSMMANFLGSDMRIGDAFSALAAVTA